MGQEDKNPCCWCGFCTPNKWLIFVWAVGLILIIGGVVTNVVVNMTIQDAIEDGTLLKNPADYPDDADVAKDFEDWKTNFGGGKARTIYKVYLFHVVSPTSLQKFHTVEVGPFTFWDKRTYYDIEFKNNGEEIEYLTRHEFVFLPEESGVVPDLSNIGGAFDIKKMYRVKRRDGCPLVTTAPGDWADYIHLGAKRWDVEEALPGTPLDDHILITSVWAEGNSAFISFGGGGSVSHDNLTPIALSLIIPAFEVVFPGNPAAMPSYSCADLDANFAPGRKVFLDSFKNITNGFSFPCYMETIFGGYPYPTANLLPVLSKMNETSLEVLGAVIVDLAMMQQGQTNGAYIGYGFDTVFQTACGAACNASEPIEAIQFAGAWFQYNNAVAKELFALSFYQCLQCGQGLTDWIISENLPLTEQPSPKLFATRMAKSFLVQHDEFDYIEDHGLDTITCPCEGASCDLPSSKEVLQSALLGVDVYGGYLSSAKTEEAWKQRNPVTIPYRIHTGKNDLARVNDVTAYAGVSSLPRNDGQNADGGPFYFCGADHALEGKDLAQWPPGKSQTLGFGSAITGDDFIADVFSDTLYRAINFEFKEDSELKGIDIKRFQLPEHQLAPDPAFDQRARGFANTECVSHFGAEGSDLGPPIRLTKPLFRDIDQNVAFDWDGNLVLSAPSTGQTSKISAPGEFTEFETHETFIEIEPVTGFVVRARERLQATVFIPDRVCLEAGNDGDTILCPFVRNHTYTIENIFQDSDSGEGSPEPVPLFWQERGSELTDKDAEDLKSELFSAIELKDTVFLVTVPLGAFVIVAATIGIVIVNKGGKETDRDVDKPIELDNEPANVEETATTSSGQTYDA